MFSSYKTFILLALFLCSCEKFFYGEDDLCGVPGGNNQCLDECGIPNGGGINIGECDCEGNVEDCLGVCGGSALLDECGVCDYYEALIGLVGCPCDDAPPSCTCCCENNTQLDCLGVCGGSAVVDECGVCNGSNSSCTGCMLLGSDNYFSTNIIDDGSCVVSYELTIQPIFDANCTMCHNNSGQDGGLDLSSYQSLMIGGNNGTAVIPFNSEESILIDVLNPNPSIGVEQMGNLSESIINKISTWIDLGAINDGQ